ncbi:MAG TPA: aminopeptidase P N-terminal domain-containing protein [Candidatus Binatia bacterium]|nr:aminopeptidase P N-terminal domain-containing protein [Candidatus Binatia bacterium]
MNAPFDSSVFADRRKRFLSARPAGSLALFPAAPVAIRSGDVEYRYRQDSDFYYLTGFPEPEALCLLDTVGTERFILFVLPRDPEHETWTGKRFGVEGARDRFEADAAHTLEQFADVFAKLLDARERLYFTFGRNERMNQRVLDEVRRSQATRERSGAPAIGLVSPADVLHEMRLRKGPEELARMRRAAAISAVAHRDALLAARSGASEHEIEATIDFAFRRLGGMGPAYPSIVASGPNATILHYTQNSRVLEDGDLLLIDAGAEYDHYCADVTRTYPVASAFSAEQRQIYEIVLTAQKAAIEKVAPGVTFDDVHHAALRILVEGLCALGALSVPVDEAIEKSAYRRFYMHRTSHWLGMDVHDVGKYRLCDKSRTLEPGMVLTVEPGLYFSEDGTGEGAQFRGIGIRIEDDVLVTEHAHEVLTAEIPKEIGELEQLARGRRR